MAYYNPQAYVPGGSTRRVAQAIQTLGRRKPLVRRPPVMPGRPAAPGVAPRGAAPFSDPYLTRANQISGALFNPLMTQLGTARVAAEQKARAAYGQHATALEGALQRTAAPIAGAFDTAIGQSAKVNEAVANRLAGQGQQASGALAMQLAQIGADPAGAAALAQSYQGAGNAGFARDSADLQHLIGRRGEAVSYQGKLPGIARLTANQDLEKSLSEQRGYFGEQESALRNAAVEQASGLYSDLRTEAMNRENTAAQQRAELMDIAQRERASIRALKMAATTAAEKRAFEQQEKALDRQLKIDIAGINAQAKLDTAGISAASKPPKVASGPNMKFNPDGTPNPNYDPDEPTGKSGNDSWQTPGSAKRNRIVNGAYETVINPNNVGFLRGTYAPKSVMVSLMRQVNNALVRDGVPPGAIWGAPATALRRAIFATLVGKQFRGNDGGVYRLTQKDVDAFTKKPTKPAPTRKSGV